MTALAQYATSLGLLGAIVALFLVLEFRVPHRESQRPDVLRMVHATVLFASGVLLTRLILPIGLVSAAIYAGNNGWGVLNAIDMPLWVAVPVAILALDATNYARHWAEHTVPLLWRIHRLHHTDEQVDLSTAFRFHPFEAVFSSLCQLGTILMLGLPIEGVLLHIVLAAVFDLWEHSNIRTPDGLKRLAAIFVTPPVHRIHHEVTDAATARNYGTILTLWDRVAGTYQTPAIREQPAKYGLREGGRHRITGLIQMLEDPVRRGKP